MVNHLFDENVTYYHMFLLADKAKTVLEKERDDLSANDALTDDLSLLYKRKLQNLYRIRNNSFVLLLRNGVKCTKIPMDGDCIISIDVDGDVHVCKESVLKTILQKDYDIVLKKATSELIDEMPVSTDEKSDKQNESVEEKVETENNLSNSEKKQDEVIEEKTEPTENEEKIDTVITDETSTTKEMKLDELKLDEMKLENEEEQTVTNEENEVSEQNEEHSDTKENKNVSEINNLEETELKETEMSDDNEDKNDVKEDIEETKEKVNDIPLTTDAELKDNTTNVIPPVVEPMPHKIEFHTFKEGGEPDVELIEPIRDENKKNAAQMIMDVYKIKVKNFVDEQAKEDDGKFKLFGKKEKAETAPVADESVITLRIIPLSIPINGNSFTSDILVYMQCDTGSGCFYSNTKGRKTVIADNKMHSFLITGSWENGRFKTVVRPTNKTLTNQAEISRELERIRAVDKFDAGIGHPVLFIKKNEDTNLLKIHVLPKENENGKDGMAPAVYCMEDLTKDERFTYRTKEKNQVIFEFKDGVYKIYSKWENDDLVTTIEKIR